MIDMMEDMRPWSQDYATASVAVRSLGQLLMRDRRIVSQSPHPFRRQPGICSHRPLRNIAAALWARARWTTAEVVVAIGGDGFMLRTLHRLIVADLPVYGMKTGNVGFLMNRFRGWTVCSNGWRSAEECRLTSAAQMRAETESGDIAARWPSTKFPCCARPTRRRTYASWSTTRPRSRSWSVMASLLATAAGSTAYNFSVRGPILPLGIDAHGADAHFSRFGPAAGAALCCRVRPKWCSRFWTR